MRLSCLQCTVFCYGKIEYNRSHHIISHPKGVWLVKPCTKLVLSNIPTGNNPLLCHPFNCVTSCKSQVCQRTFWGLKNFAIPHTWMGSFHWHWIINSRLLSCVSRFVSQARNTVKTGIILPVPVSDLPQAENVNNTSFSCILAKCAHVTEENATRQCGWHNVRSTT